MSQYLSDIQGNVTVENNLNVNNQLTTNLLTASGLTTLTGGLSLDGAQNSQYFQNFFNLTTTNNTATQIMNYPMINGQSSFCDFMIICAEIDVGCATFSGQFPVTNIGGVPVLGSISPLNTSISPALAGVAISTAVVNNSFIIQVHGLSATVLQWSIFYKVLSAT